MKHFFTYFLGVRKMKRRTGFTLIELMIVVLIVAVLAAVLVPFMRARVEAAKWSEGKAGAGTIASALRAYAAEQGTDGKYGAALEVTNLFKDSDLRGKHFSIGDYSLNGSAAYTEVGDPEYPLTYTITVTSPAGESWKVTSYTLDHTGAWTEYQDAGD
jgi:type IV pilus assembly protein PilA